MVRNRIYLESCLYISWMNPHVWAKWFISWITFSIFPVTLKDRLEVY